VKIGIDFGTTRIVVARADRGNFPVAMFEGPDGETHDHIPSLVAANATEVRYGWEAAEAAEQPGWNVTRSLKRLLDRAGPATRIDLGPQQLPLLEVLTGLATCVRSAIATAAEEVEAMIGVPANSNSNQRYLTAEAFRLAGFRVLGLLNEPSAAGVEFGHSLSKRANDDLLLIYDLGGGTFDASLVRTQNGDHEVIAYEGISTLGGDDFDELLAGMAMSDEVASTLSHAEHFRLIEQCRQAKEALNPNSRKITLDLDQVRAGLGTATIAVADYYEQCRPLVTETLTATEDLIASAGEGGADNLYVTGGGSELPLVGRMLRERFGRRVKRSAYTRAATAIGLAIHAGGLAGFSLRERFTRYFGVWREAQGGREIVFDPIFEKGAPLPATGQPPIRRERVYHPAHNIGHFRYLECSAIDAEGRPAGDITLWDDILFPFDPSLVDQDITRVPVTTCDAAAGQTIAEVWSCDANGAVEVELQNRTTGYHRTYRLGRWGAAESKMSAKPKRRRTSA
jgi:molecular chaperone DnaK (HSP70)